MEGHYPSTRRVAACWTSSRGLLLRAVLVGTMTGRLPTSKRLQAGWEGVKTKRMEHKTLLQPPPLTSVPGNRWQPVGPSSRGSLASPASECKHRCAGLDPYLLSPHLPPGAPSHLLKLPCHAAWLPLPVIYSTSAPSCNQQPPQVASVSTIHHPIPSHLDGLKTCLTLGRLPLLLSFSSHRPDFPSQPPHPPMAPSRLGPTSQ